MSVTKGKTTQRAVVPDYLEDPYMKLSDLGMQDLDFTPYTGSMVAGLTPDQRRVLERTKGMFDESMSLDPRAGISNLIAQGSPNVQSASLLDNLANYQSNLEGAVIDPFLADIDRRRDILTEQAQDRAIRAGAFGGSRSGIIESEATRPLDEATASTIAGLRLKGFQEAAKLADADAKRRQQAFLLEPQLDLKQMGLQANLLRGQLGDQYRNLGLLSSLGQQQQRLDQAQLAADRAEFDRRINNPFRQIQFLGSAIQPISPAVIGRDIRDKSFSINAEDIAKAFTGIGGLGMGSGGLGGGGAGGSLLNTASGYFTGGANDPLFGGGLFG